MLVFKYVMYYMDVNIYILLVYLQCFMNSVLQCLSNTPQLLDYCINEQYKPDVNTKTSSMKGQLIKGIKQFGICI